MVLIDLVSFVEEMTDHCGVEFFKKHYLSGTLCIFLGEDLVFWRFLVCFYFLI